MKRSTDGLKSKRRAKRSSRAAGARKAGAKTKAKGKAKKSRGGTKPASIAGVGSKTASRLIDKRIRDLAGWRGETLARMRALILEADPGIIEEWKWATPVWSHDGIVCTGEAYAKVVKLTFARGANVPDPSRLFNSSLEGNVRRAIDIREGEKVDARTFKTLVKAAVATNVAAGAGKRPKTAAAKSKRAAKAGAKSRVALLSGGNPQIAKAEGDAPVQAYIAAMPGWKRDVGERLDALIVRSVPNVRKAVKWNSPFYGVDNRGWFLSFHVFTHYVKVTFFRGTALTPVPPGASKHEDVRYVDVREGELDEAQMESWAKQAAALRGYLAET